MSIVIYTYHDPYKIDQEPYWDEIKNCPYFCSAQTLVNGLRSHYKEKFDGGRVSTVKILTDSLYVDWASPAWIVKQHTDIDNIINSGFSTDLSESERINIGRAFLFNRDDVFASIRTMFELNVDPSAILKNKLTKEQRFILGIYQKILASEMKKDFYLARSLAEEEIDEGLRRAMTAIQEDYNFSDVNLDTIVIHGVHQFNPIMLRAIDELQKYKNVILLFNYQKQYKNVYQTWFDIYSAFDCKIIDCDRNEFLATDSSTVSYKGNVLADQLGKLVNGQRRAITVGDPYEIIEFDNMTEFAGYVADIFEEAERKDPQKPMHHMREQIYAANSSANDILKIYFPEQFGERQFLNYPIGHFFLAIANMWDPEKNEILISDINDVRECLGANILSEDVPGQLVSIFGKIQAIHNISRRTRNILLLSATPVQQRRAEYLDLLRLLLPSKYDSFTEEKFGELIDKQSHIIQKTALILDDLSDFEETIDDAIDEEEDPHESEDCQDLFEEIQEGLEEICDDLDDSRLNELFEAISFAENDLGVYAIKVMISYICSNYQIESNIIRNRRKLLEVTEDDERLLPIRELETQTYELDSDKNAYEALTYELLSNWILEITKENSQCVESIIRPLLSAFFSSPWAFEDAIKEVEQKGVHVSEEIKINAERWKSFEQNIINEISKVIDDPDYYSDFYSTRLLTVINTIYEELFDQKIVLFTNYKGTFDAYRKILEGIFSKEEVSFFGAGMSKDEIELNAYRFQNDRSCRIMLCDYTGGEGRNFQCADYIVHIDLPWDANMIEQRIGRLDRLERDPSRPIVHSVVIYTLETFEEALFNFWNEGLKIFTQSLSGMEIIMKEINSEIISAIQNDFKHGLFEKIPGIIESADEMRATVRKEQNFDAAGFIYRPMYNELKRLIDYYSQNENELFANTIGYCDEREAVRIYRVDRIKKQPEMLPEKAVEKPKGYNVSKYTTEVFRMFSTDEAIDVTLLCDNCIMKFVVDKFGMKIKTQSVGEEKFRIKVKVCVSPTFYRWVFGATGKIMIEGPSNVRKAYKEMLQKSLDSMN